MMDYFSMTDWIIFAVLVALFAPVLLLPIGVIVLFYKHLPRFKHGLLYAVNHGIAWAISGTCLLLATYPFHGGFDAGAFRAYSMSLPFVATIQVAILISAWLACRLFRGKILVQDGALCETCG